MGRVYIDRLREVEAQLYSLDVRHPDATEVLDCIVTDLTKACEEMPAWMLPSRTRAGNCATVMSGLDLLHPDAPGVLDALRQEVSAILIRHA